MQTASTTGWWRRTLLLAAGAVALGLAASACGGSSSGSGGSGGHATLTIADFSPFSGVNADYGEAEQAGCASAQYLINLDGGVLGHKLNCAVADSRGDPADAVPALEKLLATTSNLVGIVDSNSGILTATVPLINSAHIPEMSLGGDIPFDHNHYPYFWRTLAGDDVAGDALAAYIGLKTPYRRVAGVFGNDQAAQGNVPGLMNGAKRLGLNIVINEALALDQTTYATEVQRLIAAKPQVLTLETDAQTGGVFLGQLKQSGLNIPGVLTSGTLGPDWDHAAVAAIGAPTYEQRYVRILPYAPLTGPAYQAYLTGLTHIESQVRGANQRTQDYYTMMAYDNMTELALAIEASHSTNPVTINKWIPRIFKGSTVVHTFAQAKQALLAGKSINYVGASGAVSLDQYHNSGGFWAAEQPLTNKTMAIISPTDIAKTVG